jgi:hypothetical protein
MGILGLPISRSSDGVCESGGKMKRDVFYSFHFDGDCWRTNQVRHIGTVSGKQPVSGNDWEKVKARGDSAVERWIDGQLKDADCTIVLIGSKTSERRWVRHEIKQSWNKGKGLFGIYIHNLKDSEGQKSTKGANPFGGFSVGDTSLSSIVKTYTPPSSKSTEVYAFIEDNLASWVEDAIKIRKNY